jgi:hypothetical protein
VTAFDQANGWVQILSSGVVGLGVIVTFITSAVKQRRDAAQAAEAARHADAAAERAEKAAALTIDELTRIAIALETIAAKPADAAAGTGARTHSAAPAAAVRPEWVLSPTGGDGYALANRGAAPAFDVRIEHDASLRVEGVEHVERIAPGESCELTARRDADTRDLTITVTWAAAPGSAERARWRYPLPPRSG